MEIKLPTSVKQIGPIKVQLSRQQLRALGRKQAQSDATAQLKKFHLSRKARRQAAQRLHKMSWDKRDSELIQKVYAGFTPEAKPQPLVIDVTKVPVECSPQEQAQQLAAWNGVEKVLS